MFDENDKVIVSENIFPESTDQQDIKMRGREGVVGLRMWEHMRGEGWDGCYEIHFPDGDFCYVTESEIRLANIACTGRVARVRSGKSKSVRATRQ